MGSILLLNGPNLNQLGNREPQIYGSQSLAKIEMKLKAIADEHSVHLECKQSNHEGTMIDFIHQAAKDNYQYILLNAAAYTHSSIAIRDALLAVNIPFIEIHLSNIYAREPFRHFSYLSDIASGCITGLGIFGYQLALLAAIHQIHVKSEVE